MHSIPYFNLGMWYSDRFKNINTSILKYVFFKKMRKYIEVNMALTIYKSTILPVIKYADFVHDFGIKYVSKKLQGLQNYGLTVVYNQHIRPYMDRVSTEMQIFYRLYHRRKLHLQSYKLSLKVELLDKREIHTKYSTKANF